MNSLLARICFVGAVVVCRIMLDDYYLLFSDYFAYLGFSAVAKDAGIHWISWSLLLLTASVQRLRSWKPSVVFLGFFYLLTYVPASSLVNHYPHAALGPFVCLSMVFLLLPLLIGSGMKLPLRTDLSVSGRYWPLLLAAAATLAFGFVVWQYGFRIQLLSLSDVYETRASYTEGSSRLSQYAYGWLSKVIVLLLFLYGLLRRNWLLVGGCLLMELILFGYGGHKTVFFVLPLVLIFFVGLQVAGMELPWVMAVGFALFLVSMRMGDLLFSDGFSFASSLFVRRVLLIPAQLFYAYCDYFSLHPADGFARNFPFSFFMESHYSDHIPRIIGDNYVLQGNGGYANAGIFADAFANAGYAGFLLAGGGLLLLLRLADRLSLFKDVRIATPLVASFAFTMANTGLIVSVVTHGFVLALLFISLQYRQRWIMERN